MYFPLETRETAPARHPGLNGYTPMLTRNTQGMRGLGCDSCRRGLGAMPLVQFSVGPGGQFSVGAQSIPTATSLWDQVKTWASESTLIASVPNSLILLTGGFVGLAWLARGWRR